MLALVSALPIFLLFALVVAGRRSVFFSACFSTVCLIILSVDVWGVSASRVLAASAKGMLLSLEITTIIFGALFIFYLLKYTGLLALLEHSLSGVSKDVRVQSMLIALALVYFMEGVAGFGTPALLAVPILLSLGFPATLAVAVALIGDSVPVIFGAIGLPITYGMGSVLSVNSGLLEVLVVKLALFNVLGSIFSAAVILLFVVMAFGGRVRDFMQFVPFAIFSALIVSLPALLVAYVAGPELPSVIGGLVGMLLIYLAVKHSFLVPATVLRAKAHKTASAPAVKMAHRPSVYRAFVPYGILVLLLLATRLTQLPFKEVLQGVAISTPSVFGHPLDYTLYPLYSAGTIIVVAALLSVLALKAAPQVVISSARSSATKLKKPFLALGVVLIFVQIVIYSGENSTGFPSMPLVLAEAAQVYAGNYWPFFAPFIGALGSFVAGSATVSNLLFANFQYSAATSSSGPVALILTLQGLGAAAGNMVALHNVVAALAIAGISNAEGDVIKKTFVPLLLYLAIIGAVGVYMA